MGIIWWILLIIGILIIANLFKKRNDDSDSFFERVRKNLVGCGRKN